VSDSIEKFETAPTHDDLGLAVTNVMASLAAGADLVHGTINGIGERAGNVALEEVAIALDHGYGVRTMDLTQVYDVAQLIASKTGIPLAPNKAVVGANAFTHESGIHTDGTLKDESMYEPYPPETVGRERRLALGKHAGRAGVQAVLAEHDIEVTDEELGEIVARVKALGERGKRVVDGEQRKAAATGSGPVDAAMEAAESALPHRRRATGVLPRRRHHRRPRRGSVTDSRGIPKQFCRCYHTLLTRMGGALNVSKRNDRSIVSPRFIGFNVALFLTFAFGYLLLVLLFVFMGSMAGGVATGGASATSGGLGGGAMGGGFFGGSILVMVFGLTIFLSPFIALIGGLFTGVGTNNATTAAVTGLTGGFLGFLIVAILTTVLVIALMGGETGSDGMLFAGLVLLAIAVVTGLTGSLAAAVSNHYQ